MVRFGELAVFMRKAEMDLFMFFAISLLSILSAGATDPCSPDPCKHNATCVTDEDGESAACICEEPYFGPICDKNPCNPNPCENKGECVLNRNDFQCICKGSFVGELCKSIINPCIPNPCNNGGTCVYQHGGFCSCTEEYSGDNCSEVKTAPPISVPDVTSTYKMSSTTTETIIDTSTFNNSVSLTPTTAISMHTDKVQTSPTDSNTKNLTTNSTIFSTEIVSPSSTGFNNISEVDESTSTKMSSFNTKQITSSTMKSTATSESKKSSTFSSSVPDSNGDKTDSGGSTVFTNFSIPVETTKEMNSTNSEMPSTFEKTSSHVATPLSSSESTSTKKSSDHDVSSSDLTRTSTLKKSTMLSSTTIMPARNTSMSTERRTEELKSSTLSNSGAEVSTRPIPVTTKESSLVTSTGESGTEPIVKSTSEKTKEWTVITTPKVSSSSERKPSSETTDMTKDSSTIFTTEPSNTTENETSRDHSLAKSSQNVIIYASCSALGLVMVVLITVGLVRFWRRRKTDKLFFGYHRGDAASLGSNNSAAQLS